MLRPSLKTAIYNAIKCYDGKIYPRTEVYRLCSILSTEDGGHYTPDNATRRMRELVDEGEIEAVRNPIKHYITGYRFKKVEASGQMCLAI